MNVFETNFQDIPLIRRGKVRDVYDLGECLLFVATDRISAFDVIMNEPIPGKGIILNKISEFWFNNTKHIIDNHFISSNIEDYPDICKKYRQVLDGRSMIVKKCTPLPVECIVRGYIAGSGWKEYQKSQTICGIPLPSGLKEFEKLPEPIFTPSTKADAGHDENISPEKAKQILGEIVFDLIEKASIELYKFAANYLDQRGIILADTKFEFGTIDGKIILIDEALTPDSSRFWLKANYAAGVPQTNFDKQILRDWLESTGWDKQPPPPELPPEIIRGTLEKYQMALEMITK
ncbi:MAG TPA: phosphoribosylaminoimidazolesuccinocarboxamide synthase [Candidatus Kapabacteria bacterium]|jgi:phosphoribosylaminoimidazole-succinocarboxamide synthase|nr:phosphoribosylaminoimidazolesuccinocarboxamide synthase [Candidatus Kapabacteria bacterium]HPP38885.1 phosphoribosylaminoimidazolesuccinocarboxamide synthase [Candidatus Kapabacteria bacterium]